MTHITLDGYYSTKQAQRIKEALHGESYMNFNIEYGGIAGNNTIIISTSEDHTEAELREMFIYCALNRIN